MRKTSLRNLPSSAGQAIGPGGAGGWPATSPATSLTFGPVYAAIKLGYFKAEDIEIESLNFQGASILLPQVANKTITIGFPLV